MRLGCCAIVVPLCLWLDAGVGFAAPIGLTTEVRWTAEGQSCSNSGANSANCDAHITFTQPPLNFPGSGDLVAEADAAFGSLDTRTSAKFSGGSSGCCSLLYASSAFSDELRLSGGTGSGFIQYAFAGSAGYNADQPGVRFELTHGSGTSEVGYQSAGQTRPPSPFSYTTGLLPFVWDDPFSLSIQLSQSLTTSSGDSFQGQASVRLSDIRVFDANGVPVGDYTIQSTAGAAYSAYSPTVVPEPPTLWLLGGGLAALVAWRSRRRDAGSRHRSG